ncbi:unnamed protein product [Brassica rapa]|uniref:Uncharacterized protein n=2 Tax=Brassica TaxID=3705 RepID=A0A8D9HDX3_BRACM|nr:unnamed protein product [Brassica napus]CAG7896589.1 unnamed protein product [Brassica rapa]
MIIWLQSCDGKQHGNSDSRRALYNNSAPFFVRGLSHDREEIGEEKCCLRAIRFGVRKYVSNWFLSCVCVWLYVGSCSPR